MNEPTSLSLSKLLSARDLAELLQVSVFTIYDWRGKGEGPKGFKVGARLRFDPVDVAEWLDQRRAKACLDADERRAWSQHVDGLKDRLKRRAQSRRW